MQAYAKSVILKTVTNASGNFNANNVILAMIFILIRSSVDLVIFPTV